MRLGRDTLKEDIQRVESVRNHIGDEIELMADANEAWRVDQALKASNELSNFNLTWLEEPITPDDYKKRGVPMEQNNYARSYSLI